MYCVIGFLGERRAVGAQPTIGSRAGRAGKVRVRRSRGSLWVLAKSDGDRSPRIHPPHQHRADAGGVQSCGRPAVVPPGQCGHSSPQGWAARWCQGVIDDRSDSTSDRWDFELVDRQAAIAPHRRGEALLWRSQSCSALANSVPESGSGVEHSDRRWPSNVQARAAQDRETNKRRAQAKESPWPDDYRHHTRSHRRGDG